NLIVTSSAIGTSRTARLGGDSGFATIRGGDSWIAVQRNGLPAQLPWWPCWVWVPAVRRNRIVRFRAARLAPVPARLAARPLAHRSPERLLAAQPAQRPATSLMTTRSISASRSGGNTSLVPGPAHQRRPVFLPSGHSSSVAFRVQFLPFTSVSFHPNNRRLPC